MKRRSPIQSYKIGSLTLWGINFQLNGIRIRRQGYISEKEATMVAQKIRADILTGVFSVASLDGERNITLNNFNQKYYQVVRQAEVKASTLETESSVYRSWIAPALGNRRLRDINSAVIARWIFEKTSSDYSPHTINAAITYLQARIKMACRMGFIEEMPVIERVRSKKRIKRHLTPSQIFAFVDYFNEPNKHHTNSTYANLTALLFYTGLRIGEACALTWDDIDFDRGLISINKRIYRGVIGTPKNGKSNQVPIHPELKAYLMVQKSITESSAVDMVFQNHNSDGYLRANTYQLALKRAAGRLMDDASEITPHIFRRSLATALVSNKAPINQVAQVLNHNANVLLSSYATADMDAFTANFNTMCFDGSRGKIRAIKIVKNDKSAAGEKVG